MESKKRSLYLDFLRIIAIFMVVYLHTGKYGVQVYAYSTSATERALGYFFAIITSEVPVPLFFMISGALLLEKEESLSQLFQKRILKILFILLFFSFVMYLYKSYTGVYQYSPLEFISTFFTGQIVTSYWYLYAYLAYLLCLPLLRRLVKNLTTDDYFYLLILNICFQSIPNIIGLWIPGFTLNFNLVFPFSEMILFYPLMGYFVSHLSKEHITSTILWKCWLISSLCLLSTFGFTLIYGLPKEEFTAFDKGIFQSGLMDVFVLTVFYTARYREESKAPSPQKGHILSGLSSVVFGIYLIETPFREGLRPVAILLDSFLPQLIVTILWTCAVVFICGIIVYTFKRVAKSFTSH